MTTAMTPRILAFGARSPLGLSALQVAMCARAQKIEPRSTHFIDHRDSAIGVVRSLCLSDLVNGFDRFAALGAPALREATQRLPARAPIILALPDKARPDQTPRFESDLIGELAKRSGAAIDLAASSIVRADNAGFGFALEAARSMMTAGAPAVIVGGIDSYFGPEILGWLDEDRRLHSEHSEAGIIPSEGAAFFLLGRPDLKPGALGPRAPEPIATVAYVATGREEAIATGEPSVARTMTALARAALAASKATVAWVVTDVNGERHRIREDSMVATRLADAVADNTRRDQLARELGDVGAATGALHLAVALAWLGAGAAPATSALFLNYAEGPERAAFLVEEA